MASEPRKMWPLGLVLLLGMFLFIPRITAPEETEVQAVSRRLMDLSAKLDESAATKDHFEPLHKMMEPASVCQSGWFGLELFEQSTDANQCHYHCPDDEQAEESAVEVRTRRDVEAKKTSSCSGAQAAQCLLWATCVICVELFNKNGGNREPGCEDVSLEKLEAFAGQEKCMNEVCEDGFSMQFDSCMEYEPCISESIVPDFDVERRRASDETSEELKYRESMSGLTWKTCGCCGKCNCRRPMPYDGNCGAVTNCKTGCECRGMTMFSPWGPTWFRYGFDDPYTYCGGCTFTPIGGPRFGMCDCGACPVPIA